MRAKSALALRGLAFLLIVSGTIPAATWAQTQPSPYGFQRINVFGAPVVLGYGVNNSGTVAGIYNLNPQVFDPDHGFTLSGTQPNSIDIAGADSSGTDVFGINDLGDVVGSFNQQGFLLTSSGQFATINFPNSFFTIAAAVNNLRQVVGWYQDRSGTHGFLWQNGQFFGIAPIPGGGNFVLNGINNNGHIVGSTTSSGFLLIGANYSFISVGRFTNANGINDSDVITGFFLDSANATHGFVLTGGPGGHVTTLDAIGVAGLQPNSINNAGVIVGSYPDQAGNPKFGFIATPVLLLDPVPDALSGSSVTTNGRTILDKGIPVQGTAADGVAQIVVAIPARSVGDQFTLTLLNDNNSPSSSSDEDGALARLGGTNFTANNVSVSASAVSGQQTPFAFALYRAPLDFARIGTNGFKVGSCATSTGSGGTTLPTFDDRIGCRTVFLQVQGLGGSSELIPIKILRPPVVLVHGLWSDGTSWNNFAPLYSYASPSFSGPGGPIADQRFRVDTISYNTPVPITSSNPQVDSLLFPTILGNAMGLDYNAPQVSTQIDDRLQKFREGQNPQGVPVAGVQADIVAHSMGGNIVRFMASESTFLSPEKFGAGNVHKLITIATPHLGTPLATQLLSASNDCTAAQFALLGKPSLLSVVLRDGFTVAGAVGDLQGDGNGQGLSPNLSDLNNPLLAQHPLPTALIAASTDASNLAGINDSFDTNLVRSICLRYGDPVVTDLTSSKWNNLFSGQLNDALVPINSQLNRINGSPSTVVAPGSLFTSPGNIHSPALLDFGFRLPSVLDPGSVPTQVITLLNTPVNNPVFNPFNP